MGKQQNAPLAPFARIKPIELPATDPMAFLVDDEIREFKIDRRWDLTGTGLQKTPTISNGVFIIHEHQVPADTGEVVSNVFPHCWVRTNIGAAPDSTPAESVRFMLPEEVEGFVLFDMSKDSNQPYLVETEYNPPNIAANPNNTARKKIRGTTWLAKDQPLMENVGMRNPLSMIYLPPNSIFRVTLQLLPVLPYVAAVGAVPARGGIPNPLLIGAGGDDTSKRIDFAGACVTGVRMPAQTYNRLKALRMAGLLGVMLPPR